MTEWENIRRKLKVRFKRVGITRCEIKFDLQCWDNYALSFAHAKKRRFLKGEELEVCVLACARCHTAIEGLRHAEMESLVLTIIADRPVQP
jgi:hypothetical protein